MTGANAGFAHFSAIPEAAFHSYGTAEDLPLEVPAFHPRGDPTESYRVSWGFYCTGESGVYTLSAEHLMQFFELQSTGKEWLLSAIFEMLTIVRTGFMLPAGKLPRAKELLGRIRARRGKIQAHKGVLTESYLLIREDRER